jgi:hypothetical protein
MIILLKKTFEQFPASYKGNISTILREILKNSKATGTGVGVGVGTKSKISSARLLATSSLIEGVKASIQEGDEEEAEEEERREIESLREEEPEIQQDVIL